jgi:tRNA (adenine57-N1/adenine58-N1)-methyltransferase
MFDISPGNDIREKEPRGELGEVVICGGVESEIADGERFLAIDSGGRKYILTMLRGQEVQLYKGVVAHTVIARAGFGGSVKTHKGALLRIHRVNLDDFVLNMPRSATPIYPKDACTILMMLNVSPGFRILEAGSGSGGLTLYLARALAGSGAILSFDSRASATNTAARNVRAWAETAPLPPSSSAPDAHAQCAGEDDKKGKLDLSSPAHVVGGNIFFYTGDVGEYELSEESLDAAVLDMMEPWQAVEAVTAALCMDRSLVCVCPNITQVTALVAFLKQRRLHVCLWRTYEVSMLRFVLQMLVPTSGCTCRRVWDALC